jgi:Ca2+-binding RTX toxin-like protein
MAVINGTRGNDRIVVSAIPRLPIVSHDTIHGLQGHDYIDGGDGDDTLYGDEGNDVLIGGLGVNYLYGGLDDDRMIGGKGTDHFDGGAGKKPTDLGMDTVSYENAKGVIVKLNGGVGTGGDALGDTYVNIENVDGSNYADELTGDGGANILRGLNGDDELSGLGGVDTLRGGEGHDRLYGGQQGDFLYGDNGNDLLTAETGSIFETSIDHLDGGGGDDTLTGSSGDVFIGGTGIDTAYLKLARGSLHFDLTVGGPAATSVASDGTSFTGVENFRLYLTDGSDEVRLGAGDDIVYAYFGQDEIYGGEGADTIRDGTSSSSTTNNRKQFFGEGGDDVLVGGSDDDSLNGGSGADILAGGGTGGAMSDSDDFVFDFVDFNTGVDTILDYDPVNDWIRFNRGWDEPANVVFFVGPDPRAGFVADRVGSFFFYDTDDGHLYYAESRPFIPTLGPQLFAILDGAPAFTDNIFVT